MSIVKVLETEASNAALKAKVKASESKENAMRHELAELRERARELAVKSGLMQNDIAYLTSALAVRSTRISEYMVAAVGCDLLSHLTARRR